MTAQEILRTDLFAHRARLKGDIFRKIRRHLSESTITRKEMAVRLDMNYVTLCSWLKGDVDLTLEDLSDMASALDCRIKAVLVPINEDRTLGD